MKWHDAVESVINEYTRAGGQAAAEEVLRLSAALSLSASLESALSEAAITEIQSRERAKGSNTEAPPVTLSLDKRVEVSAWSIHERGKTRAYYTVRLLDVPGGRAIAGEFASEAEARAAGLKALADRPLGVRS